MKALLFALALAVIGPYAAAMPPGAVRELAKDLAKTQAVITQAAKYPRAAVVKVEAPGPFGGTGSAVVLQPGLLLTARHVAEVEGLILSGGGSAVRKVGAPDDVTLDVAALKADVRCPCAELAETDARIDEAVILVGYPLGFVSQVMHGESQGVHEAPTIGLRLVITVIAEGGNSGGGAFVLRDGRWQLVGILAEGSKSHSLVVPVSAIRRWLEGRK